MRPCASKTRSDKRLTDETTYVYDRGDRLIAARTKSYYGDKTSERAETCTRDAAGRLLTCMFGDLEKVHLYQDGRLKRSEHAERGRTVEKRDYRYDDQGRLTLTRWRDNHYGDGTTGYTYNDDGTLATTVESFSRNQVTLTFAYNKGRLVGYRSESTDRSFRPREVVYLYDKDGRVTAETQGNAGGVSSPSVEHLKDRKKGDIIRIGGGTQEHITYTYDQEGRLVKRHRDLGDTTYTTTFDYTCR
jgi:YD repeat-containing protein